MLDTEQSRLGRPSNLPNIKTVEIKVRPFLGFPPVVSLAVERLFRHGDDRRVLRHGLEENSAPANSILLLSEERGQVELYDLCQNTAADIPKPW